MPNLRKNTLTKIYEVHSVSSGKTTTCISNSLCQLHRSVGHDRCKLSRTCERFPICDDKITENDRCVIKIIGIHCSNLQPNYVRVFFLRKLQTIGSSNRKCNVIGQRLSGNNRSPDINISGNLLFHSDLVAYVQCSYL